MSLETYLEQFTDLPVLSPDAAWERQGSNARLDLRDVVASTAPGEDPTKPAELGDQFFEIEGDYGEVQPNLLPFVASRKLVRGQVFEDITTIISVQHGELGNVWDYYHNFIKYNLQEDFDKRGILVVATQAPRTVDCEPGKHDRILRWGTNTWRNAEPAEPPCPPYSYFEVKDYLIGWLHEICPNLALLYEVGNSEGGQELDKRLAWGRAEIRLERDGVLVRGRAQNPGMVQYWHPVRPAKQIGKGICKWREIPSNDPANRWGCGLYDPKAADFDIYGPPPYIRDLLQNYHPRVAILNSVIRTFWTIGERDNDPTGSRLPRGPGPDAQGLTRVERMDGKRAYMHKYITPYVGIAALVGAIGNVGHAASETFAIEMGLKHHLDCARLNTREFQPG